MKNDGEIEIWAKAMTGGAHAVGLFNRGGSLAQATISCQELQLCGGYTMRDVWRQADAGTFGATYSTEVPSHGVVLLRLTPRK